MGEIWAVMGWLKIFISYGGLTAWIVVGVVTERRARMAMRSNRLRVMSDLKIN
jgi:hypothetical protein